jgi:hypothetical protein
MAKKPTRTKKPRTALGQRVELTADESLKRMRDFPKRMEAFVAAARKGKNRSVSA